MLNQLAIEGARVVAQLFGTALIAWVAVRWALSRFKAEKTWEHRLAAYTRATTAIGDMKTVATEWIEDYARQIERPESYEKTRRDRYRLAKAELEQCVAIARLVLPEESFQTLRTLQRNLAAIRADDAFSAYDEEIGHLGEALDLLVEQGKTALR